MFFTILSFGFGSEKGFSQNEKVSFDAAGSLSVEEILEVIKKQTDYNFIYRSDLFADGPKIRVAKGRIRIGELLERCAELTDIEFQFSDNKAIFLKKRPKEREKEEVQFTVSGIVTDTGDCPCPGPISWSRARPTGSRPISTATSR